MTITLFHASDLHFGKEDRRALDWFADCVRSEKPDAVAITGDLTMRARHRLDEPRQIIAAQCLADIAPRGRRPGEHADQPVDIAIRADPFDHRHPPPLGLW